VPLTLAGGQPVSSTRIRGILKQGDCCGAAVLLGRPWGMGGQVEKGQQQGRLLGFPTANITWPPGMLVPRLGVYAVTTPLGAGVANIGTRPTVGGSGVQLEAHVFDFTDNLYGQNLTVQLQAFVRDEQKFANLDVLKAQIHADAAAARDLFYI
jgi:riboflavin kinase / FMN adenylyltransferase